MNLIVLGLRLNSDIFRYLRRNEKADNPALLVNAPKKTKYQCNECEYVFARADHLKRHRMCM